MSFGGGSSSTREPGYYYHSDENAVNIRVELPGVAAADLEVHTEVGKILVKGKRFSRNISTTVEQIQTEPKEGEEMSDAQKEGDAEMKQTVTPEVVFVKEFHVPQSVDADKTRASFKDGLLELCIPKKQQHMTRQIKIDVSS